MATGKFIWKEKQNQKILEKIARVLKKEKKPMLASQIAVKARIGVNQVYQNINMPRARTFGIVEDKCTKWKRYSYKPLE